MNQKEFTNCIVFLADTYRETVTESQTRAWYEHFKTDSAMDFTKAIMRWSETNRTFPTVADLKGELSCMKNDSLEMDGNEGWNKVKDAIRRYGYYNSEEAVESLDPVTREAVERMGGFQAICMMPNDDWTRKNFVKTWEEIAKAKKDVGSMNRGVLTEREKKALPEQNIKLLGD